MLEAIWSATSSISKSDNSFIAFSVVFFLPPIGRQTKDGRKGGILHVLGHGHFDIVQHGHVLEQPDILKGPGDTQAVDLIRLFADDALPSKRMAPLVGVYTPVSRLNTVVLPAPLGPIRPTISFSSMVMYTLSSACRPPK